MQSLTTSHLRHHLPTQPIPFPFISTSTATSSFKPKPQSNFKPLLRLNCSLPATIDLSLTHVGPTSYPKPSPAEVSRTIMEISSAGTLSTLNHDGCPLGVGVRFAVDSEGTPVLCINASNRILSVDKRSSLHVQLKQCGVRTPQCTVQGGLDKPDKTDLQRLLSLWKNKFGEEMNEELLYVLSVDRVLQIEDFQEDGIWVTSSAYKTAKADPLRDVAENIVNDINNNNMEDVLRFCRIYADLSFEVSNAQIVWVDRLGFDMRLHSLERGLFEVRIPFPREVSDEKGAKASFNGMSQIAWEVEKNYIAPDFDKVRQLKQIAFGRR